MLLGDGLDVFDMTSTQLFLHIELIMLVYFLSKWFKLKFCQYFTNCSIKVIETLWLEMLENVYC